MNRRDLIVAPAALLLPTTALLVPETAQAALPAEGKYRTWDDTGSLAMFKPSVVPVVQLDASFGTSSNYGEDVLVSAGVRPVFHFTGRVGLGPWYGAFTGNIRPYAEVIDVRSGLKYNLYKYDRIQVRFADGSTIEVQFVCATCSVPFILNYRSARDKYGTRLYPRRCGSGTKKCSGTIGRYDPPTSLNGLLVFSISLSFGSVSGTSYGDYRSW